MNPLPDLTRFHCFNPLSIASRNQMTPLPTPLSAPPTSVSNPGSCWWFDNLFYSVVRNQPLLWFSNVLSMDYLFNVLFQSLIWVWKRQMLGLKQWPGDLHTGLAFSIVQSPGEAHAPGWVPKIWLTMEESTDNNPSINIEVTFPHLFIPSGLSLWLQLSMCIGRGSGRREIRSQY